MISYIVVGTVYRPKQKVQVLIILATQQAANKWLGFKFALLHSRALFIHGINNGNKQLIFY